MRSSTVLDSWNDPQLRTMKLGGNAAAAAALGVRVGMVPASPAKYDNRAGSNYKKRLADLVRHDQLRHGTSTVIPDTHFVGLPTIRSVNPSRQPGRMRKSSSRMPGRRIRLPSWMAMQAGTCSSSKRPLLDQSFASNRQSLRPRWPLLAPGPLAKRSRSSFQSWAPSRRRATLMRLPPRRTESPSQQHSSRGFHPCRPRRPSPRLRLMRHPRARARRASHPANSSWRDRPQWLRDRRSPSRADRLQCLWNNRQPWSVSESACAS